MAQTYDLILRITPLGICDLDLFTNIKKNAVTFRWLKDMSASDISIKLLLHLKLQVYVPTPQFSEVLFYKFVFF